MIAIDSFKPHYEIRARDIDPDTGDVSKDWALAIALQKEAADMIAYSLNITDEEPNRMYYVLHREEIIK
jgi:hypothetical protein